MSRFPITACRTTKYADTTRTPIAAYTLEVNAGEVDRFGIRVGQKVKFDNIDNGC